MLLLLFAILLLSTGRTMPLGESSDDVTNTDGDVFNETKDTEVDTSGVKDSPVTTEDPLLSGDVDFSILKQDTTTTEKIIDYQALAEQTVHIIPDSALLPPASTDEPITSAPINEMENTSNNNPIDPEIKPLESETKPTEPEIKPTEPEINPAEPEIKPAKPEMKPAEYEIKPTEPEIKPDVPEIKPIESQPTDMEIIPGDPECITVPYKKELIPFYPEFSGNDGIKAFISHKQPKSLFPTYRIYNQFEYIWPFGQYYSS